MATSSVGGMDLADEPTTVDYPVIHWEDALRRFDGDLIDLIEIALLFLDGTPAQLESLQRARQLGDRTAVQVLAHRLAGAASNLSAHRFVESAKALESASADPRASLDDPAQSVLCEFQQLESCIRKYTTEHHTEAQ